MRLRHGPQHVRHLLEQCLLRQPAARRTRQQRIKLREPSLPRKPACSARATNPRPEVITPGIDGPCATRAGNVAGSAATAAGPDRRRHCPPATAASTSPVSISSASRNGRKGSPTPEVALQAPFTASRSGWASITRYVRTRARALTLPRPPPMMNTHLPLPRRGPLQDVHRATPAPASRPLTKSRRLGHRRSTSGIEDCVVFVGGDLYGSPLALSSCAALHCRNGLFVRNRTTRQRPRPCQIASKSATARFLGLDAQFNLECLDATLVLPQRHSPLAVQRQRAASPDGAHAPATAHLDLLPGENPAPPGIPSAPGGILPADSRDSQRACR